MGGLMSFVNTLASSPIGKMGGGYMEGKIDEKKEEARLQEKKDDRYASITDGLVNNLLTIEANTIAEASKENDLYKDAVKWAVGKFGDGGYAVAEKMRNDGAFSGMKSFQDVLNYVGKLDDYGANLPEGSDPWYMQPEWTKYAEDGKDWRASNNIYTERLNTSHKNIGRILKDNGIGDNTFKLLSGFDTSRATYNEDAGRIVATDQTSAEAVGADPATVSSTLPTFTPQKGILGIKGFSESSYSRQVEKQINQIFPKFTSMFFIDNSGVARLNRAGFGDDEDAFARATNVEQYINRTKGEANDAYQTGEIKDKGNPYNAFATFYNPQDFDEVGFVQKAIDDYSFVVDAQKSELIKLNVLNDDLREALNQGVIPQGYIAELSEYLDNELGLSWTNYYFNSLGDSDKKNIFRERYNKAVNAFLTDEKRLGKQSYTHNMKFIDPEKNIDDVLKLEKGDERKGNEKPYLDYHINYLKTTVGGDFGVGVDIDTFLYGSKNIEGFAPNKYAEVAGLVKQLGVEEFPIILPGEKFDANFDVNIFNAQTIADNKFKKTNKQIEGMEPTGGKILESPNMRTTADVLAFVEQYNGKMPAIKQAIMGLIINDIQAGNIDNMSGKDIVNLVDTVMLDIGTLVASSYSSTDSSENTAVAENIVSNAESKTEEIVKEEKTNDAVLAEALQEATVIEEESKGIGEEPWLFENGEFNPDFNPDILEGGKFENGTPRGDYEIAKIRYAARQRAIKNKESASKIVGNIGSAFNWIKNNALISEEELKERKKKKNK